MRAKDREVDAMLFRLYIYREMSPYEFNFSDDVHCASLKANIERVSYKDVEM